MPTFEEAKPYLRPVLSLGDKKKYPMGPGKAVYLSHARGDHLEKRWVPGNTSKPAGVDNSSVAGETADLYATAKAFLIENPEFQHIWVCAACMPPRLREQKWRGAVPSATGSNMFEHLHPGALLACDAVLVAPPERESMSYVAEQRERYTDLEMYSTSPWKALEGAIAQLMNTMSFYAFRLGKKLVFVGPYPSYPQEPQPSPLDLSRRSSAPSAIRSESPVGRGVSNESPVDRMKVAAKSLLSKGSRLGWNNNHHGKADHHKEGEEGRWGGWEGWDGSLGGPHSSTPTGSGSVTTGSVRSSGKPEKPGSRIDHAVEEALDRLQINGTGSPPERNWRGVLQPSFVLRKARHDVEKYSDAQGALKQAMCSMSVSVDQAEEFFVVWKHLGVLGPCASKDRLAVLNLLLFSVAVADGYCCPRRPRDFVSRVLDESLVTQGHLDLWMKDLSPDDSRAILRSVNTAGTKLSILTVGSSHTAGAGVGTFLRAHPTLKELELEWEGVRDLSSIAQALADHKSLTRLNLTHNEIGPRGAIQLAGALRQNKSLTELDLRENSLGPTGMKAIADALASNDTMRTLHLQDNAIGDDGVIAMTEALMRNGRLRTVCLDGNKVSDLGAKVICIAIKMNPALKLLSLSRNALPDQSKRELYDAWSHREMEDGQAQSGMFLEKAAHGTVTGREGWKNGLPPGEGVFVSTRPGSGAGVLVSPTRDRHESKKTPTTTKPVEIPGSGSGKTRGGGDSGGFMPRFSPVNDTFVVKKPLW
ncbi:unnamed protein product [Scytosiphon promiscuus]